MRLVKTYLKWLPLLAFVSLTGCGGLGTLGKLNEGAGAEASKMWDRWVDSGGDIAVATTWERKVKAGVTVEDIENTSSPRFRLSET